MGSKLIIIRYYAVRRNSDLASFDFSKPMLNKTQPLTYGAFFWLYQGVIFLEFRQFPRLLVSEKEIKDICKRAKQGVEKVIAEMLDNGMVVELPISIKDDEVAISISLELSERIRAQHIGT